MTKRRIIMKNLFTILFLSFTFFSNLFANGVCIIDAKEGIYLRLVSSDVNVRVDNQVAIVKTTQIFSNNLGSEKQFKYAFPLSEEESAISLRWYLNDKWYEANIAPTPQDTTLPGGGGEIHPNLKEFLGDTPLYFEIEQPLPADSTITIELTYVTLLPYEFGSVILIYPHNYLLIQDTYLDFQQINFELNSERTIENLLILSHSADSISIDNNHAFLNYFTYESKADKDYEIQYSLSLEELGLFGLSTFLNDTIVPDQGSRGFFIFVAEPDPSENTEVINKVFTLIIDRSGSMSGSKIVQARDAATFIVNNLNEGDKFNIVDFASNVSAFQSDHVEFNETNESSALSYISALNASGSTNISGAFNTAVPQFSAANDSTANIIIFFTDGQATAGITSTEGILSHVNDLVNSTETELTIFTFGIGNDVNEQLLTLLATQHNGLAEFLGSNELEDRITKFYLLIRNPVLLNTNMSFSPQVVSETYPSPLPNLYKGQQMIVAGRYSEAVPVEVHLNGEAFGKPVFYNYQLSLADTSVLEYQFLTKIWAKSKIEYLLVKYYSLDPESEEAKSIREDIIDLSITFGVITPFTSFSGDYTGIEETYTGDKNVPNTFVLLGNHPNPFNPGTTIRFQVNTFMHQSISIKIYNLMGELIRIINKIISGPGIYEVYWDGRQQNGKLASSGTYFYIVDFGQAILGGKMTLLK